MTKFLTFRSLKECLRSDKFEVKKMKLHLKHLNIFPFFSSYSPKFTKQSIWYDAKVV